MSIWSSIRGHDVQALNYHDPAVDEYTADGPATREIGVATAVSYNDHVRLSIMETEGITPYDVCLLLSPANVERLRDQLDEALRIVRQR